MALRKRFRLPINPRATNVLVRVVPILAPRTMGTALVRGSAPDATIATVMALTIELLCMRAVAKRPMKNQ